jgi:mono/diheme cytochrome c family protein
MCLSVAALVLVQGCGPGGANTAVAGDDHNASQASSLQSGAQLWADNCSRCHNIRPPQSYSDAQWQAVVMHMRLRADLTGREQREITRFLQASH